MDNHGHKNLASVENEADKHLLEIGESRRSSIQSSRTAKGGEVKLGDLLNHPKSKQNPVKADDRAILTESEEVHVEIEEDDGDFNLPGNQFTKTIDKVEQDIMQACREHKTGIWYGIGIFFLVLYAGYFCWALSLDLWRAQGLWIITICFVVLAIYKFIQHRWGDVIYLHICAPPIGHVRKHWRIWRWLVPLILIVLFVLFAWWIDVFKIFRERPHQLISGFGLIVFILFSWLCSKRRGRVQWSVVFWGVGLQLALGIFILRSTAGYVTFNFLGDQVQTFLEYTDVGSEFVFSAPLEVHFVLFKVLPVIIFCSYIVGFLDYVGIMGWTVKVCAWVMQYTMGVSGVEALCAAANIFVGHTIAPVMVKNYLPDVTPSELHCVAVGGLATIAGTVLGAYISFGISAAHLISASVLSAPAAIAVAKIFYPETRRPKTLNASNIIIEKRKEKNVLEAMVNAAQDGLMIFGAVVCQLIAVLATLAFVNAVLAWLGSMVNCPQLTFQLICRYLLYPFAWLMGVETADCEIVAELIGVKTFLNEFVAYLQLADLVKNGAISVRSQVIATYALCGFTSLDSLGIMIGVLGPMIPERKGELVVTCIRAIFAATIACCMTACVAGLLYDDGRRLFDSSDIIDDVANATSPFLANTTDTSM
ncbi:solute carrier family 28 member 3-like [Ptychodera flava]|uniref:solute carrier family 28 member 3-like n=1 Tax=Ptychodera flava TaxID=63121 RepID=UPI00396A9A8F